MADSDTSPANSSRLLTPLPPLRQLSEEPEQDDAASVRAIPFDSPALTRGPAEMPSSSEASGSQITSSDKLTALPSHLRSSSVGRPVLGPRANNGSSNTDVQDAPSTLEARFAPTSTTRGLGVPPPISHSLSDSVAERGNHQRGRISYDSDRGSSTSPLPGDRPLPTASEPILPSTRAGTLSSFVARAHETVHERLRHDGVYKHRPGHSRRASQLRRNSVGSHTRTPSLTGSPQRSPSPSRGVLPLRSFLGRFSPGRGHHREEPFVPIDPFRLHAPLSLNPFARCFGKRPQLPDVEVPAPGSQSDLSSRPCVCVPLFGTARFHNTHTLAFDTLPRQFYLHLHLRLPSLYFSRVARIFEDAAVSRPEIQRIIDAYESVGTASVPNLTTRVVLPFPEDWVPPNVSPALARFKRSWESFVDSLVREWKTLNVLSALLLSAILTLFQIQDAATDPLIRTAALCSLVSALMSLSYGIMYIVRFGNMRSMYRASRWAEEAQKTETAIFWNVWVLLALPGVWLAWSVLAFIVAIMSFLWRTGARGESHPALSRSQQYGPRIAITCQFFLGLVYFALVIRTFRNYGETGRKARVVRRFADAQFELETRAEWAREAERERDNARTLAREGEEGARDRGRSRASDSMRQKEKPLTNELGLSGMERKQEAPATSNGDVPASDSFSSLGM